MNQRHCKYCGYELLDGDTYCPSCHMSNPPSGKDVHEGNAFVSRRHMSTIGKLALITGGVTTVGYVIVQMIIISQMF